MPAGMWMDGAEDIHRLELSGDRKTIRKITGSNLNSGTRKSMAKNMNGGKISHDRRTYQCIKCRRTVLLQGF